MCLNLADSKLLILVAKSLVVKFSLEKVNRNPAAGTLTILAILQILTILPILGPADLVERSSQIQYAITFDTTRAKCKWPPTARGAVSRPSTCAYVQAFTWWVYHVKMTISNGKTLLRHRLTMPAIHSTTYGRRHRTRSNTITLSPISIPNDFATRISTKKTPNFKFHWQKVI